MSPTVSNASNMILQHTTATRQRVLRSPRHDIRYISILLLQIVWLVAFITIPINLLYNPSKNYYSKIARATQLEHEITSHSHAKTTRFTLSSFNQHVSPWIELVHQTDWVTPGNPFNLVLTIDPHQLKRSQLNLSITVFRRLRSRSAFQLTIHNQYPTPILQQLPSIHLGNIPTTTLHNISLNYSVVPTTLAATPPASQIALDCSPGNCGGVYPVRIELFDTATRRRISEITTQLIYTNPPRSSLRLRFAMVIGSQPPLLPTKISNQTTTYHLTSLVNSLLTYKNISADLLLPLNSLAQTTALNKKPNQTIQTIENNVSTTTLTNTLEQRLATAVMNNPNIELPMLPYAPINPSALLASNLQSNIVEQLHQGTRLIGSIVGPKSENTHLWISTDPLTKKALELLYKLGVRQLLLPQNNLAPISTLFTPTQPFSVTLTNHIKFSVLVANRTLATHFINGPNALLGIHQLLADLAQIYYDEPNFKWPRAVAVIVPESWEINSSNLLTLFHALSDSPIIKTTTLSNIFSTVPSGVGGEPSTRKLAAHLYAGHLLPTTQINHLASEIRSLQRAVPQNTPSTTYISLELLSAEASHLAKNQREAWLEASQQTINDELHYISTPPGRDITLTSRQARIPITILSHAPYPLSVEITLKSDKLIFPHGASKQITLSPGNTTIYFTVITRASGDFPLHLLLQTPAGGLTFLNTNFTVHSLAISAVALVLTIGAIVFLLLWWLRTVWRPTTKVKNTPTQS